MLTEMSTISRSPVQGLHVAVVQNGTSKSHFLNQKNSAASLFLPKRRIVSQRSSRNHASIYSWSLFKKLGMNKPSWLPDFGRARRQALLERLFSSLNRRMYEEVLSPTFSMIEEGNPTRRYSREGELLLHATHFVSYSTTTHSD